MNLIDLAQQFSNERGARAYLENLLWPDGPICPKCGLVNEAYKLQPRKTSKSPVREGVYKCKGCGKQFTVTVNTIFEDSHIPLHKWMMAIHLMNASKKGMSAHQIHRMLGLGYRAAWFMCHRIRYAMNAGPDAPKLNGTIEADETYVGGKVRGKGCYVARQKKAPVVTLVERNGKARSFHFEQVCASNLRPVVKEHIEQGASLMTDDSGLYASMRGHFSSHDVVKHSLGEYARHEVGKTVHTNTVEGFFSILKRGIFGTYHHIGKQHLHRYLDEFDFRYNARDTSDGERSELAVKGVVGKRLMYRDSSGTA